ncbi:FimV/HubP family polar landmark protein [Parahaliea mediterranea]|uniref:FimV family protein n=1 Tax=Parahaliea mediterranea TaxID=651086 RepID=A0A939DHY6_9GAMM|nr:FimV/HubP family polar landmark protein [Parahaliea mediterranea]MBN7798665.1 FimV family protein [Parahaliea mediterranea]
MASKRKLAAALLSLGCLQASSVWALGLGELTLETFLNEPLRAEVELLNTGGLHEDQIRVRLATTEDFDRLGVDRAYFLTGIKFEVRVDDNGRGRIVLTSDDPVLEPYLDLIIETRWPSGRLLREYTVLVDPPAFDESAEVVSASERVEAVEGIPAPAKKKTEPEVATGTRVGVGEKSGLAPGAMPERQFSAGTAQAPTPGSQYMIRRDQTLWQIAQAAAPEGVSVHQAMLDIQRLNPDAFIGGNINRIKAGYIIYLPAADEIRSGDLAEALAEVRQQNEDWRAGRASATPASAGPSLRISAAAPESEPASGADRDAAAAREPAASAAALEDLERAELENSELQTRLDALAEQVQTLENIVSVKDAQIASLQAALREAGAGGVAPDAGGEATGASPAGAEPAPEAGQDKAPEKALEKAPEIAPQKAPDKPGDTAAPAPAAPAKPAARPAPEADTAWAGNLLYPAIAVLLALLGGLFFWRRRQAQEAESEEEEYDVFAGVELRDQDLQVDEQQDAARAEDAPRAAPEEATDLPESVSPGDVRPPAGSRGYGEGKHDQYASDVDTGDALAEADIYIAYGRYPQAIELLRTATAAEPGNPEYRLKLVELFAQVGRQQEAEEQLQALREIGDTAMVARGEEVLSGLGDSGGDIDTGALADSFADDGDDGEPAFSAPTVGNPAGANEAPVLRDTAPEDLEIAPDFDDSEVAADDFSELEIEGDGFEDLDDELDLSRDFEAAAGGVLDDDDEDLVFATEGNQMSTKLDLARAYIDMGDEEGARQILEEVSLEGSEEQQQEAQALMARLG